MDGLRLFLRTATLARAFNRHWFLKAITKCSIASWNCPRWNPSSLAKPSWKAANSTWQWVKNLWKRVPRDLLCGDKQPPWCWYKVRFAILWFDHWNPFIADKRLFEDMNNAVTRRIIFNCSQALFSHFNSHKQLPVFASDHVYSEVTNVYDDVTQVLLYGYNSCIVLNSWYEIFLKCFFCAIFLKMIYELIIKLKWVNAFFYTWR